MTTPTEQFERASAAFRKHLPDLKSPRFTTAREQDAYEYSDAFQTNHQPPWLYRLTQAWQGLYKEPFKGLTTDGRFFQNVNALFRSDFATGTVIPNIFKLQDEEVNVEAILECVEAVLGQLTPEEKKKVSYPLDAREWRAWSNPEFLLRPFGLRLDEIKESTSLSILNVLKATFSPEGYEKAIAAMRINHFLGEICDMPKVMNKYSYNFLVFGTPSATEPWGWSLYGHHLCLNVFLKGPQIVISPTFTGAEPNIIDDGEFEGTAILHHEGALGQQLMQSLPEQKRVKAQIFKEMYDPRMDPTGDLTKDRWNKDDQRHVCGAFRDNRIVPYEGVNVSAFTPEQQKLILAIAEQFVLYLPKTARELRLKQIEEHFKDTYFCWIGPYSNSESDAYYYRIQSPVIVCEFDHHSGVFLTNEQPERFHTHTLVRTPNGGDYGACFRDKKDNL
jgi:hypothetical protein